MVRENERLVALDALRGLAVAGMVLVTNPGDWNKGYPLLLHADWNGWTPTDIIFPTFLFAVGMALGLGFPRDMKAPGALQALWLRVGRRVIGLIAVGLALELINVGLRQLGAPGIGPGDLAHMRLPGVLQRIGVCYGLAAALIILTGWRGAERAIVINVPAIIATIVLALCGYWALMTFVPVPGFGAGHLDPEGNLAAYLDRQIFTVPHLWPLGTVSWGSPVVYDPEGVLSTFPALTNTLWGVLAAYVWKAKHQKLLWIAGAGAVLVAVGLALDPLFPINKRIWTSSFALLSSGLSALTLVVLTLLVHGDLGKKLSWPLRVLGSNAILAFAISIIYGYMRGIAFIPSHGKLVGTQEWGNAFALSFISDPYLASYANAFAAVVVITAILAVLQWRGIHLRL